MVRKLFFIFFFYFFFFQSANSNITSKCNLKESFSETNKIDNIDFISIEIVNKKKWLKNIFLILRSGNWISNNFKKQQRANIVFLFKNGLECNFKAKIRFHGDNPDHIIVVNDFNFITSLDVQLIESNIENITKFKLFIPHTRGGDQEILATNFLRELNFFAPKTKYINASINGLKQKYLFQEKISKEFIESNGFTEGPIIEGDQRLLWEGQRSLQLSRIINKNWVKQNWRNAYVALDSLSRVNELYLKFYQSINNFNESKNYFLKDAINIIEKDNYKSDFYLKNLYFDRLIFSLGGQHALVPDNRTFYYNYIENNFYPIFYDANINRNTFKFDKSLKNQKQIKSNIILDQLKKIDLLNNIQQKNKKAGLSHAALISYEGYFSKIEKNYRNELKTLNESKIKNIQEQNFNNFYKRFKNKKIKLIFFNKKPNVFLVCDKDILKCKEKIFSLAEISEIVSQRYKSNSENIYIFVTSDFKKYKNNHLVLYKSNWEKIKIHKSFYAKIKKEEIELKFDNKKKEIFIKQKKPNGRVIFFSKEAIEDWKFNFESIKEFDKSELLLTKDSIDGCITFYDMKVKKLKFLTKNAFCEDSINLIRSKGSIDEILIYNPLKDGIDLDFSNIKIKNIYVVNSGDDCIDLSYGDYKIEKSKLYNCFDNGISIGEKSNLISETLSIKDSKVGVAVKDSSKVSIDLLNSINNQFCFKIYNKKQEFLGGELRLKNMNCSNNLYKVETGSKFTLINDF